MLGSRFSEKTHRETADDFRWKNRTAVPEDYTLALRVRVEGRSTFLCCLLDKLGEKIYSNEEFVGL